MASAKNAEPLKVQLERLRAESIDVVTHASRIVVEGVQKLAEQELKALNDYYKGAMSSAKQAKGAKSSKAYQDMASEQIDLLQDTVQKVLSNARASLGIIAETRAELARLTQDREGERTARSLARVTEPARKAVDEVRKAAGKAQKSAADTAKALKKSLEKEIAEARQKARGASAGGRKSAGKAVRRARRKLDTVLDVTPPKIVKKSVEVRPSSTSRAARAARKSATRKSATGSRSAAAKSTANTAETKGKSSGATRRK